MLDAQRSASIRVSERVRRHNCTCSMIPIKNPCQNLHLTLYSMFSMKWGSSCNFHIFLNLLHHWVYVKALCYNVSVHCTPRRECPKKSLDLYYASVFPPDCRLISALLHCYASAPSSSRHFQSLVLRFPLPLLNLLRYTCILCSLRSHNI